MELIKLNMRYKEILVLDEMLRNADIPHDLVRIFDGYQIWYPNKENAVADVIEHFGSYGHEADLLEIMGLLTPEEEEQDAVLGCLSALDVYESIDKHYYTADRPSLSGRLT